MNLLRKIENSLLVVNPNVATNIRPLNVVTVVYKTSSNEFRTCQDAIVLAVDYQKIKVAIINPGKVENSMVRTFFLHSPLIKSIVINKKPRRPHPKHARNNFILEKNIKKIKDLIRS